MNRQELEAVLNGLSCERRIEHEGRTYILRSHLTFELDQEHRGFFSELLNAHRKGVEQRGMIGVNVGVFEVSNDGCLTPSHIASAPTVVIHAYCELRDAVMAWHAGKASWPRGAARCAP